MGFSETNELGQKWRWLGQEKRADLLMPSLKAGKTYILKTHIHTALGKSLNDLKVEVNGFAIDPRIVRKGNEYWHICLIPKQILGDGDGPLTVTYHLDNQEIGPQIALSQVVCRPLIFSPGDLYRINRRRIGRFVRRFIPRRTTNLLKNY